MSQKLCACGCGQPVKQKKNTYIHGHNAVGGVKNNLVQTEQVLCGCGCGLPVEWKYGTYRRGHYQAALAGRPWTSTELALCACGCGQQVKTKGSKYCRGHGHTPESRQANSERMKANNPMKDAAVVKRMVSSKPKSNPKLSETLRHQFAEGKRKPTVAGPEARKRFSERMKKNNPMKNADVVAKAIESHAMNGSYQRAAERMRHLWEDPEYHQAQVDRMKSDNPMFKTENVEKSLRNRSVQPAQSKMELWFEELCRDHNLPIWYSGMSSFWVNGKNPDFKVHGRKMVIEITDGYTHQSRTTRTIENYATPTLEHYKTHGYSCLVIMMPPRRQRWNAALQENLVKAIQNFLNTEQGMAWSFDQ